MDNTTFAKAVEGLIPTVEDKYGETGWSSYWESGTVKDVYIADVELVESFGGEGEGERRWLVFKVTPKNGVVDDAAPRYFKKEGYYSSWDGSDWDGAFTEVRPVEKYVTAYEPK